jgi:hypothetical protein
MKWILTAVLLTGLVGCKGKEKATPPTEQKTDCQFPDQKCCESKCNCPTCNKQCDKGRGHCKCADAFDCMDCQKGCCFDCKGR